MSIDGPIVNLEVLGSLKNDLGAELVGELVTAFLDDIQNHYAALQTAQANHEADKLEVAAHTIKGMAGNLGIDRVFRVSQDVVTACRTEKIDDAITISQNLLLLIDEARDYLKNFDPNSL